MTSTKSPTAAFIAMMATIISIVALATDIMLPVLPQIAHDLNVANENDTHLVVSVLFVGFAFGQLLVGPLSDAYGRRPVIFVSYGVFFVGCIMTTFATSFDLLLLGRLLQGAGIAGPRIVSNAIIRDLFSGRTMARVMSLIMMLFILVPIVAPLLGQTIAQFGGWRSTFATLLGVGILSCIWFAVAQPETHPTNARTPFSLRTLWDGAKYVVTNRAAIGYIITLGFIFGPFLGYLGISQKLYHDVYNTGLLFPLYFALGATSIGAASLTNARLVERLGMGKICRWAMMLSTLSTAIFLTLTFITHGTPPLWTFMVWVIVTFFAMGLKFGNLSALAMEPLGHIAGMGAALFGALSTLMSLPVAWVIGITFTGTITPLIMGFGVAVIAAWATFEWANKAPRA